MLPLTKQEIEKFEACKSGEEWDSLCDEVKAKRGGSYPSDWWERMHTTGRMDRILQSFGESSDIKIKKG